MATEPDSLADAGDMNLLAVGDRMGQVDVDQVGFGDGAASGQERIFDDTARRKQIDVRVLHRPADVHAQQAGGGRGLGPGRSRRNRRGQGQGHRLTLASLKQCQAEQLLPQRTQRRELAR